MIKRYKMIDITKPREAYEEIKRGDLKMGYIRSVMCAFKWKTKDEEYGKIIKEIIGEIKKTEEPNKNRFKKIKWEEIEKPEGDTQRDLIIGLYTLFPPRRLIDYANMVYKEKEEEIKEKNEEENYYIKEKREYIFQNYKTVGKYGKQRFKVSDELGELIERYVKRYEIKTGDALIKNKKGSNRFSRDTLMTKIKKIFGTSVDGLRHSYITYLYKNMDNLFDIEDTSMKMAHNVGTHLKYLDRENR